MSLVSLSLVLLGAGFGPLDSNLGYYLQPSIHGNDIVFVSQGDLWHVGLEGGIAHALTGHDAPAGSPAISPDGRTVAFVGSYEGPAEVYVMPIEGGAPKRLTYEGVAGVAGWTPAGKVLAASRYRSTLPNLQLATIDPNSGHRDAVPLAQAADGAYDDAGKTLFFTRLPFQGSHTKRYEGGTAQGIWKYTSGAPEAVNLTKSYPGSSKGPMFWKGRVYFLSDRDGIMNVWSMNPDGGDLRQHTHSTEWDIQSAALDAGRIVYQKGADLFVYEIEKNAERKVEIRLASDFEGLREHWIRNPLSYMTAQDIAPDGSRVVLTVRGQIFVAPADTGRLVEVTRKSGVRYRSAIFSADGKSIFALSDQTGETEWWRFPANGVGAGEQISTGSKVLNMGGVISPDGHHIAYYDKDQQLWDLNIATKQSTKIAASPDGVLNDIAWSPDSKWLAIAMPSPVFSRIVVYSVATGKSVPITTERSDAMNPAWSPDGKWLYFISSRTFRSSVSSPWGPRQPEPFFDRQAKIYSVALTKGLRSPFFPADEVTSTEAKPTPAKGPVSVSIEFNGIQDRLWEVPAPAGNYNGLSVNGDRLFTLDSAVDGPTSLKAIDIKDADVSVRTLATGVSSYALSLDGKKLSVNKGGQIFVVPAGAGGPANFEKPVDLANWSISVQPREEWRQMFNEAWRLERDYFYDKGLLSVDWNAVKKKYEPLVDRVRDRQELSNLLGEMIGELSTLHMFVYGGDLRQSSDAVSLANLGAELEKDRLRDGFRIAKIYQGDPDYPETLSPLVAHGVDLKVGDIITAVNGEDVMDAAQLEALLRLQAGKQVLLHVRLAAGGERDCVVRPLSGAANRDLRYTDWEISRRKMVEESSHGDIGYLHLRAMGSGDIATWERDFYPAFNRSGLIIDVRHNNGGNIDSWILEKLLRKAWFYWQPRVGTPTWNMQYAFRGHVVVLCDEFTSSDGEAFSEGIKRLNIGKLIGTRTWGGEVWLSSDNLLGDGGIATAAETGVYGPEGKWLIEGHGVEPDIEVDNLPHATYLGKDAQLEAALAFLAREIKEHPVPVPPAPKYMNKSFRPKTAPRTSGQ